MSWAGALLDWRSLLTVGPWSVVLRLGSRYQATESRVVIDVGDALPDDVQLLLDLGES